VCEHARDITARQDKSLAFSTLSEFSVATMVIRTNTQRIGTEVVDMVTRNLFGETTRNMRNMNAAGTMRTTTRPMVRKGLQIKIRTLTMKDATAGAARFAVDID
jgi:hypothetical protein